MSCFRFGFLAGLALAGGGLAGQVQASPATRSDIETADLSRDALVARIMEAGTSASEGRRTGVEIDGCMVTTFAHLPYKDFGWTLHTLFEFDLGLVQTNRSKGAPDGTVYLEGPSVGFVFFKAIPPYKVPHEMPSYRNPKNPIRRSDRQGVVDYYFIENETFLIIMENVSGPEQASDFARGLMRLRSEFCLPSLS